MVSDLPRIQGPDWHDCVDETVLHSFPKREISRRVENLSEWAPYRTSKERRRVLGLFQSLSVGDAFVIRLLSIFTASAPTSAYRDKLLAVLAMENHDSRIESLLELASTAEYTRDEMLLEDIPTFMAVHQMFCLLKKYPFEGWGDRAGRAAIDTFWETEEFNRETNNRWRDMEPSGFLDTLTARLSEFFGEAPSWDEIIDKGNWGPGTNRGFPLQSCLTSVEMKTAVPISVLKRNVPLIPRLLRRQPIWARALAERYAPDLTREGCAQIVDGSQQFHATKNAMTHRSISTEPSLEGFLQAGIGIFIRQCFQREQRNLSESWRTCQKLAHIGSVTGIYVTADLKAASDSNCYVPLMTLFSGESNLQGWFARMDRVRCSHGHVYSPSPLQPPCAPGDVEPKLLRQLHKFELFSSMGNGYSFELESALFYCVLTSIIPGAWVQHHGKPVLRWPHIAVFGDDLAFPAAYVPQVFATLEWLGFRVNQRKSYVEGPFRESCGLDLVRGVNVRPLFLTKVLDDGFSLVDLANRVWTRGHFETAHNRFVDCEHSGWLGIHNALTHAIPLKIRKLIATPAHVNGGLWEWHSDGKCPGNSDTHISSWRVFLRQAESFNSTKFVLHDSNNWPSPVNLSNLLVARLRNLDVPVAPFSSEIRGVGEEVVLRNSWVARIGYST